MQAKCNIPYNPHHVQPDNEVGASFPFEGALDRTPWVQGALGSRGTAGQAPDRSRLLATRLQPATGLEAGRVAASDDCTECQEVPQDGEGHGQQQVRAWVLPAPWQHLPAATAGPESPLGIS